MLLAGNPRKRIVSIWHTLADGVVSVLVVLRFDDDISA